jgi:signal transduction histidine kinase
VLVESRGASATLTIASDLALPGPADGDARLAPDVEATIYRLVQEALTNVTKHAQARHARVAVIAADGVDTIDVRDDGAGFDTEAARPGFGLTNMRERVTLAGGTMTIDSGEDGTRVAARIPAPERGAIKD